MCLASARNPEALAGFALEAMAMPALSRSLLPAMMAAVGRSRADPQNRQQANRNSKGAHEEKSFQAVEIGR
jgi:hypothetical protein